MNFRRVYIFVAFLVVALGIVGVGAVAADGPRPFPDVNIAVGGDENVYTPDSVVIAAGDTVTWTNIGGYHNVVAYSDTFPSNGGPSGNTWVYSYTFATPGVYTYYCVPHESEGMTGTITVVESTAVSLNAFTINEEPTMPWGWIAAGVAGVVALSAGVVVIRRTR